MHDAVAAEKLGIPSIAVMTTQFVSAAQMMSRVLGMPDYPFVVIDHPVSSASHERLGEMAMVTMQQGESMLVQASS